MITKYMPVVCAAFSVELGFKAMIMQAGAKAGGHNLLTLIRQRDRRGSLLPFGQQPARFKLAA